jgi:integrase
VSTRPYIARLRLRNTRATSFTGSELEDLLDVIANGRPATPKDPQVMAHPDLVPPIVFGAVTGWRMRSEVLRLTRRQVDFAAGTVSLVFNTTKSGQPRAFPFGAVPRLADLTREQRERTTALERATGAIIPWVFHRRGQPIRNMHMAWHAARKG